MNNLQAGFIAALSSTSGNTDVTNKAVKATIKRRTLEYKNLLDEMDETPAWRTGTE